MENLYISNKYFNVRYFIICLRCLKEVSLIVSLCIQIFFQEADDFHRSKSFVLSCSLRTGIYYFWLSFLFFRICLWSFWYLLEFVVILIILIVGHFLCILNHLLLFLLYLVSLWYFLILTYILFFNFFDYF